MNRKAIACAAAILGLALVVPAAQAETRYVTPEQKAAEVAKQGPEALRRFILRTRMIYALSFYDFYKPQE
jgi:hypothetical protein